MEHIFFYFCFFMFSFKIWDFFSHFIWYTQQSGNWLFLWCANNVTPFLCRVTQRKSARAHPVVESAGIKKNIWRELTPVQFMKCVAYLTDKRLLKQANHVLAFLPFLMDWKYEILLCKAERCWVPRYVQSVISDNKICDVV